MLSTDGAQVVPEEVEVDEAVADKADKVVAEDGEEIVVVVALDERLHADEINAGIHLPVGVS